MPKITGRVIPNYDFAALSFWTLLVVGGWTGGRHLIGGPVPAWISTISIVSCAMLGFHYVVTALNLRGVFGSGGTPLKFLAFGVVAYVVGGFVDAATALRSVAQVVQFTWFSQAQTTLAISGAFSLIAFGAIYFLVPRIHNQAWPSAALIRAHFIAALVGLLGLVFALVMAGLVQGRSLADAGVSFTEIASRTRPWVLLATAAQAVMLFGNLLLSFNFVRVLVTKPAAGSVSLFRQPATMEASVS